MTVWLLAMFSGLNNATQNRATRPPAGWCLMRAVLGSTAAVVVSSSSLVTFGGNIKQLPCMMATTACWAALRTFGLVCVVKASTESKNLCVKGSFHWAYSWARSNTDKHPIRLRTIVWLSVSV
uniref:Putative secreted protein n=1 Tax=Anopheles darlingi TaxID=43151 RepID=A0A2M4D6D5_ANODA